jgi:hypothetical protein
MQQCYIAYTKSQAAKDTQHISDPEKELDCSEEGRTISYVRQCES